MRGEGVCLAAMVVLSCVLWLAPGRCSPLSVYQIDTLARCSAPAAGAACAHGVHDADFQFGLPPVVVVVVVVVLGCSKQQHCVAAVVLVCVGERHARVAWKAQELHEDDLCKVVGLQLWKLPSLSVHGLHDCAALPHMLLLPSCCARWVPHNRCCCEVAA